MKGSKLSPNHPQLLNRQQRRALGVKVAVGYCRVSTDRQQKFGISLVTQETEIKERAESLGYCFGQTYVDGGISGADIDHRLGMLQLLEDAEKGLFDAVIIYSVSRASRDLEDFLLIVSTLESYNIELISITEQLNEEGSSGNLTRNLFAIVAQFERERGSELTAEGMNTLARNGHFTGGKLLGYRSGIDHQGRKTLIIVPEEAEIVKYIFSAFASGKGYLAIANNLNQRGLKTVKGNSFSAGSVKTILQNHKYGGIIQYGKYRQWKKKRRRGFSNDVIVAEAIHEAIIDKELFEKVNERLETESIQPKWNHRGENLLTGVLRCPKCAGPMAASNVTNTLKDGTRRKIRYYSCATFRSKGKAGSGCNANSIRADFIEKFVADRLTEIVTVPSFLEVLVREINTRIREEIKPLEQELAVLETTIQEMNEKLESWKQFEMIATEFSTDIQQRKEELTEQLIFSKQRVREILSVLDHQDQLVEVADVEKILTALDKMLKRAEKAVVKQVYRSFIDRVEFDLLNKEDIKITMRFDETVIKQLNQLYQEAVSHHADTALFVLKRPFTLIV
ncbi:recombinase family protein [Enterococcus hulanensis]|uniref:recombinase family protein n=1 Tax=Enterococcus hulanensis TaxID=2559929 RepID=UPI001A8E2741|nr:recombinase family protein [Enterococcus hulanensis]MBO0457746.1 recombinase family protein [Enterococcus hulanensis]